MSFESWTEDNRRITRVVLQKIASLPAPLKTAVGAIPLVGNLANVAFGYTENHKFMIVKLAKRLDQEGKLSSSARSHLHSYERALEQEQRAYNSFLKCFEEHL